MAVGSGIFRQTSAEKRSSGAFPRRDRLPPANRRIITAAGTNLPRGRLVMRECVRAKGKHVMKDSLSTVLEAVRAAQAILKDSRNSSVTIEQLRDILCGSRVLGAVRTLSDEDVSLPRAAQTEPFPRHIAAS
jgi:hypothetical protein